MGQPGIEPGAVVIYKITALTTELLPRVKARDGIMPWKEVIIIRVNPYGSFGGSRSSTAIVCTTLPSSSNVTDSPGKRVSCF